MEGEPLQYPDIEGILDKYLDFFVCVVGLFLVFFFPPSVSWCLYGNPATMKIVMVPSDLPHRLSLFLCAAV